MTKVIFTVFILAFGIMPRELARLKSLSLSEYLRESLSLSERNKRKKKHKIEKLLQK